MKCKELDWDSNFFGFKVAKIEGVNIDESKLDKSLKSLKKKNFTLVYASFREKIDSNNIFLNDYEVKLVDKKITYLKDVDRDSHYEQSIYNYDLKNPTKQMLKLAVESGVYSRFNYDKKIGKSKFEELYKLWMINSANGSFAKKVIVFKEASNILGMITLTEKSDRADIGIIAVDSDSRGKGIGKALMKAAEKWAYHNGYCNIQVVTQGFNIAACQLYKKIGFSKEKVEFYYHLWLKI